MRELSLNIMDIAQNSIAAGAGFIAIGLEENSAEETLRICIEDDGNGMDEAQLAQVQNPFYSTRATRKIGLGVPFFKMACEQTGGAFSISSAPGKGTLVEAIFHTGHIDMAPVGDINDTILLLVTCNPDLDFHYTRRLDERSISLDTRELREILDGVPLGSPDVALWIKGYLAEQQAILDGADSAP